MSRSSRSWVLPEPLTLEGWRIRSECRHHPDLPWTSDEAPERAEAIVMATVCAACPVWRACAEHVVSAKDEGGFWAGVWLPWKSAEGYGAAQRRAWHFAMDRIQNKLADTSPPTEN